MDETELKQNADFLSIALESIENGSYEVADEFVADVATFVESEMYRSKLEEARHWLDEGDQQEATELVEAVYEGLLSDINEF